MSQQRGLSATVIEAIERREAITGRALRISDMPPGWEAAQLPDAAAIQQLLSLGAHALQHKQEPEAIAADGWPSYPPALLAFFQAASEPGWMVPGYDTGLISHCLQTEGALEDSDLPGLCLLLTFIVRGERFCTGHWYTMLKRGYLRRWLQRLSALAPQPG